jgi:alpha-ketoglutarate-dependent taurine dioxygenase
MAGLRGYLKANQDQLRQLMHEHGGLLFRGFDVESAEDFNACVAALDAQAFDYVGGNSPRTRVAGDVYTSTEYPASETISLHNEMSYLPTWPRRLFFFSHTAAATGGQTSLASSTDLLNALPDHVVGTFQDRKLNYVRNFPANMKLGKTWQATYGTEDREEAEQLIRAQGSACTWASNGDLRVTTRCDALTTHPDTGATVWFNQAEQWHPSALHSELRKLFEARNMLVHHCEHGDGSPIDEAQLDIIRSCANRNKLLFGWQKGDVLMIDNILMMHGREPFTGSRKTLAYLSGN